MPIILVPADYAARLSGGTLDGGVLETSIAELLPHSFGPELLEPPRQTSGTEDGGAVEGRERVW